MDLYLNGYRYPISGSAVEMRIPDPAPVDKKSTKIVNNE